MTTETNKPTADSKIIKRIKALFSMSQDTSSIEEATIALKRYQSLIAKYGITEQDLETSEFGNATGEAALRMPKWKGYLAIGIAAMQNCIVNYEYVRVYGKRAKRIKYEGFAQDAQNAVLLQDYLYQTLERALKVYKKESGNTGAKASTSFSNGFSLQLQKRMTEMAAEAEAESVKVSEATQIAQGVSSGTSLMVVKMKLVESEFGRQKVSHRRDGYHTDGAASNAGRAAGSKVNLNKQVSSNNQKALT